MTSPASNTQDRADIKPVVVTRSEASDGPLSSELRNLGLQVLVWPAVRVTIPETGPLDEALKQLDTFDWIVFASRHAVAAVIERIKSPPPGVRIAAVGQATAQVLRGRGWPVDLLPDKSSAAALVGTFAASPDTLRPHSNASRAADTRVRILFPASSRALPTIAAGLSELGADVLRVEAYRTDSDTSLDVDACRTCIAREAIGAVTFASPSAVEELERALGKADFDKLLAVPAVVAIGPTTARALTERGCIPVLAEAATLRGLALTTFRLLQTRH